MVNLDIYTDPSRYAVQALRSNIVEVEVEVTAFTQKIGRLKQKRRRRLQKRHFKVNSRCFKFVARIPPRSDRQMLANVWGVKN